MACLRICHDTSLNSFDRVIMMFIVEENGKTGIIFSYSDFILKKISKKLGASTIHVVDAEKYLKNSEKYLLTTTIITLSSCAAILAGEFRYSKQFSVFLTVFFVVFAIHRSFFLKSMIMDSKAIETIKMAPNFVIFEYIGFWSNTIYIAIFCRKLFWKAQQFPIFVILLFAIFVITTQLLAKFFYSSREK